jgi:single-strand DNA-binding protein
VNHLHLIGRLGADPKVIPYKDSNQPKDSSKPRRCLVQFDLAVDRARANPKTGETETDWLAVTLFDGPAAKYAAKFLGKGDRIALTGRIETGTYEAEAGQRRKTWRVIAEEVIGLDLRERGSNDGQQSSADAASSEERQAAQ